MSKKAQLLKKLPRVQINTNQMALDQKMQFQLLKQEIQQLIIQLNTLPRAVISAFFIPFLTRACPHLFSWLQKEYNR